VIIHEIPIKPSRQRIPPPRATPRPLPPPRCGDGVTSGAPYRLDAGCYRRDAARVGSRCRVRPDLDSL